MQKKELIRYFEWFRSRRRQTFFNYYWYTNTYLPNVLEFQNKIRTQYDHILLADSYRQLADMFYIIDIPRMALRYYKLSIRYDPKFPYPYNDAGDVCQWIGDLTQAKKYFKKGLKLKPDFKDAQESLNEVMGYINTNGLESSYTGEEKEWEARELLASGKPKKVLTLLSSPKNIGQMQYRSWAYMMLKQKRAFYQEWDNILHAPGYVVIKSSDVFFMPNTIFNSVKFWYAMEKLKNKFHYEGGSLFFSSYLNYLQELTTKPVRRKKEKILRHQQKMYLLIQFHISRLNKDVKLCKSLLKKHPSWDDIQWLHKRLTKK